MQMNNYMLGVMDDLRKETYFFKTGTILTYSIPKEDEVIDSKIHSGRTLAVWDLATLGAITIYNKGEERIPGTTTFEFEILIIQPSFDGIYKRCISSVKDQSLEDYENQIYAKNNSPKLLAKLNEFIKYKHFGKKERKLLELLATFEPILLRNLKRDIPTPDVKSMKGELVNKLSESEFTINMIKNHAGYQEGAYQLVYSPPDNYGS